MKYIFSNIIAIVFLLIAVSCSNDFLNEGFDKPDVPAGESAIYISPEWESADYQFYLPGMENTGFEIKSTPSWLKVGSKTGTLINSVASIHCSAKRMLDFNEVGIYLDKIEVLAGKKMFYVPVGYLVEGDPRVEVGREISIQNSLNIEISNQGNGILVWDIVSMPSWLDVDMDRFNRTNYTGVIIAQYSSGNLPLSLRPDEISGEVLKDRIILKTNDKYNPTVTIDVTLDIGRPGIDTGLYDNRVDFGATSTSYSSRISASGDGMLMWSFEELPEWLSVTPSKGIYATHTYYEDIVFTCDRTKLKPGVNTAVIYLKSNASNNPSVAITVIARTPGDNANIRTLEGNVTNVVFDKNANVLYYITSAPNKLVAYDVIKRTALYEVQLDKDPTCFTVSEDYTKAAIGYNKQISVVNLGDKSMTNFEVNGTLYDIAWGIDGWLCYTKKNYATLCWVNANDLSTYESYGNYLCNDDIIKKTPDLPYVVSTSRYLSPSGFMVYSASTKEIKSYEHMNLGDFWFSQDGQYIFGLDGYVYETSNILSSNNIIDASFSPIGQLEKNPANYYCFRTKWLDHSSVAHSIWSINDEQGCIDQHDDNGYAYKKSYFYSDLYQPQGQSAYEVAAHYVFSNKEGTELSVLRKGKDSNGWSIEFMQVEP